MTANSAPFGLRPVNANGTPWNGQARLCRIPASQAAAVFLGDPLVPLGTADDFGVPDVGIASAGAGNTILGSFIGACNGPAGSGVTLTRDTPVYHVASVANYVMVTDDPNICWIVQEDAVGGSIANMGYTNGNLIAGAGSTVTGYSGWMLDSSSVDGNANATFQVKVLGLARGPDNPAGDYGRYIVRLNLPALWAAAGY